MPPAQKPPQRVEALSIGNSKPATFIFLHGYGDEADSWLNIAQQFHSANKLPHLSWIFPNAPHNHEAMSTAWYTPTSFSPIPVGRSSKPEDEDDDEFNEEGEDEILDSVEYTCKLIDEEVKNGVPIERIVVGGFSQGCAVSLVLGLVSRYAGKIGGVVGLSGYLPRGAKIKAGGNKFKESREGKGGVKIFLAHGTRDMLVPMRVFRDTKARVGYTIGEGVLESHEYEGMGHATCGPEFRDMCEFLEKVLPD
ncbi:acyl-protein thioesterase 1 [Stipitochalara longipes BDJ]|nr:acyl-protein thioesterase 1 [Stipitochalara longipes BDJ]